VKRSQWKEQRETEKTNVITAAIRLLVCMERRRRPDGVPYISVAAHTATGGILLPENCIERAVEAAEPRGWRRTAHSSETPATTERRVSAVSRPRETRRTRRMTT